MSISGVFEYPSINTLLQGTLLNLINREMDIFKTWEKNYKTDNIDNEPIKTRYLKNGKILNTVTRTYNYIIIEIK